MNFLLQQHWWKYLSIALLAYTIVAGLLLPVPHLPILHETIRNLYFHVPMWFGMLLILLMSFVYSIKYLRSFNILYDTVADEAAGIGVWFGVLGLITGMIWAKYTWGDWWSNDPKQLASAVGMLIYLAYFVLRGSIDDQDKRAKISAVYNIFAFCILIPVLFIVPRLTDSMHPGNGGNPGFNAYDLDSRMRLVFYPAVFGWTLLGVWMVSLQLRYRLLKEKIWQNK